MTRAPAKVMRPLQWSMPVPPVRTEVIRCEPAEDAARPPLLFVHGMNHGAWVWQDTWMPAAAQRGWSCVALSLRGHGASEGHDRLRRWKFRDYEHDVMQVIVGLPRPPILVGHSMGALVVRRVIARYPAPGAVLIAPPGARTGLGIAARYARRRPAQFLRALAGQPITLDLADLFTDPTTEVARDVAQRLAPEAPLAQYEILAGPRPPAVDRPVLVMGGSRDALVPVHEVTRTAGIYGGRAHVFRGMGHDLVAEPRWPEPCRVMLAWLEETWPLPSRAQVVS